MEESRLNHLLEHARQAARGVEPSRPLTPSGCLTFTRAAALARDPGRWQAEERSHAARCRRCAQLSRTFAVEMPHLTVWDLLRYRLGVLPEREQRLAARHLGTDACASCRRREELLRRAADGAALLTFPADLPHPRAAGAAAVASPSLCRASGGDLEAELFEDGPDVVLEIRTRKAALNYRLVAYSLRGARGRVWREGFAVLQPDVEGWYTAQLPFRPSELFESLNGRCEEVLVSVVDADALSREERQMLLDSVGRSAGNEYLRHGWKAWVEGAVARSAGLSEEAWDLVCEIRERLTA